MHLLRAALVASLVVAPLGRPAHAQVSPERARVLAVADSALALISKSDMVGFTDLMIPEAVMFPTVTRDGASVYRVRTRAEQRSAPTTAKLAERGWNAEVKIQGPIAMVWYPYDFYLDGKWSHCGVDVFTLVQTNGTWRIASMAWTAEQPPACSKHPAGPPTQ